MSALSLFQKAFRWCCKLTPLRNTQKNSLTIVTGASSPFYVSLRDNLLATLAEYEKCSAVYVWDLGLSDEEHDELISLFPRIHVLKFDYNSYPEHFELKHHNYAFKSACIWETMHIASSDNLLWLDAGCGIKNELKAVRILLRLFGFYSPYSSTTVGELTYPSVLDEFDPYGVNKISEKRMLSGGVVGLNMRNKRAVQIIREWHQLTYRRDLLAPDGSNRDNHRQDQSLLSVVYYSRNRIVPLLARRYYEFMVHLNKGK